VTITAPPVLLALVLAATAHARVRAEEIRGGQRVVPRSPDFVLRVDDEPVEPSRRAIAIYRVEQADGPSLWLKAEGHRLDGGAMADQVIPVERAVDFFSERIRTDPHDVHAFLMRALIRHDRGAIDGALKDYDAAIRLDPGSAAAYAHRGRARSTRDPDGAIADFGAAIRLDPKQVAAYISRGAVWADRKGYDRAIEDYSEAIWLEPLAITAYHGRARAWSAKKEHEKAIIDYNMVIRLDPGSVPAYTGRALAWEALGAYAKAIADLDEAVRIDPGDSEAQNNLAWIRATCPDARYRDGRRAVESATKACELTGRKNAAYLATLAAACAEAADFDAAVKWQTRANALGPEAEEAQGAARLGLYRAKKPYRQTRPDRAGN
jgi:tetratricopeptide (TPR) repeat protein